MSSWHPPANTQGRYIRVQLEAFESLCISEIEVFGNFGLNKCVGRVSYAAAGRDMTVAVIRAATDSRDVESAYRRAAYADAGNADILRQLETFALEYVTRILGLLSILVFRAIMASTLYCCCHIPYLAVQLKSGPDPGHIPYLIES